MGMKEFTGLNSPSKGKCNIGPLDYKTTTLLRLPHNPEPLVRLHSIIQGMENRK
jgi:hypothetical protein